MWQYLRAALGAALLIIIWGCTEPPAPPEAQQALSLEQDLWRAGASVYAPDAYQGYLASLTASRELLARERGKLVWFRNYEPAADCFRATLEQGRSSLAAAEDARRAEENAFAGGIEVTERRLRTLRQLTDAVKDKRLALRRLVQAELLVDDARALQRAGKGEEATKKLAAAEEHLDAAVKTVKPLIARYADRGQVARWRTMVEETVKESKQRRSYAIVVSKIDRELTLYKDGRAVQTFQAGLGFNFLSDKLYSGDRATPEGRYEVIKKLPASKFYRALLINYPNAEDQKRFQSAKQKNLIPKNASIGGLIEIHGGGKDGMTYGCVALENDHMEQLFQIVEVGTPVVIVGAVEVDQLISSSLEGLN